MEYFLNVPGQGGAPHHWAYSSKSGPLPEHHAALSGNQSGKAGWAGVPRTDSQGLVHLPVDKERQLPSAGGPGRRPEWGGISFLDPFGVQTETILSPLGRASSVTSSKSLMLFVPRFPTDHSW